MLRRLGLPRLTLALGMIVALIVSACGGAETSTPTPATSTSPVAGTTPTPGAAATAAPTTAPSTGQPKRGGTLRQLTYGADVADWDVYRRHSGNPTANQYITMFNTLMEWDPKDPTKPMSSLADSWTVSADGKTYTFKLHPGVTWHDGKPFTADDAAASFDHAIAKWVTGRHGSRTGDYLDDIVASAKAADATTLAVTLNAPDSTFASFATSYLLLIVPKHILDANGGAQSITALTKWTPIGTGPFKFKAYDRSIRLAYEKNPNYWRKDDKGTQLPYLDAVELLYINDTNLQFAAIRTGKFDLWPNGFPIVADSTAAKLKEALGNKITVTKTNASLQDTLDYNLKGPLTGQKEFRQAVNLIMDREELKTRAYEGSLLPGAVLDPSIHGAAALPESELRQTPGMRAKNVDHEEARKILEKLNITAQNPANVRIISRNLGFHPLDAQVIANQLKPFNINAKVELYEAAVGSDYLARGDFDMNPDPDPAYIPDPWFLLDIQYVSKPSDNPSFIWEGAAQDKIRAWMNETRGTTDQAKRTQIFLEMQRFILTNGDIPASVIGYQTTNVPYYTYVKGYTVLGGIYEGLRHDWTWLDK